MTKQHALFYGITIALLSLIIPNLMPIFPFWKRFNTLHGQEIIKEDGQWQVACRL